MKKPSINSLILPNLSLLVSLWLVCLASMPLQANEPVLSVTVKPLSDILETVERGVPANLVSLNDSSISAQLSALVTTVAVQVGDQVRQGAVLAELDCRDAELNVRQARAAVNTTQARIVASKARVESTRSRISSAEARYHAANARLPATQAQLQLAQSQLQRNQTLRQDGLIPTDLLDQAQANYTSALSSADTAVLDRETAQVEVYAAQADLAATEADALTIETELESLQSQLAAVELVTERCVIRAPFAGQITARLLQQGQLASPGQTAFQLLQNQALEVSANLSNEDISDLQAAASLYFVSDEQRLALNLRAVVAQITGNTRTQEVRLRLASATNLPVGKSGRLVWQSDSAVLASNWLLRRDQGLGIMLAVDNQAVFHVLPNAVEGQPARVDLPPDTLLIDQNRIRVRDEQTIRIIQP